MSREWIGLFFAVMACGSLQTTGGQPGSPRPQDEGAGHFDSAAHAFFRPTQDITVNHVRVAFLLGLYSTESNKRPEGATWIASAIRMAHTLGLHLEKSAQPVMDGEMRRRLWWSLYTMDRISSLAVSLPMSIHEDDSDVPFPSSVEDRYIQPQGFARPQSSQPPFSGFVANIQVVRLYWDLSRALRSSVITPETLQAFDERFHQTLSLLPEQYQSSYESPLEVTAIPPLFALQSARFCLYRQNLSPVCRHPERNEALRRCVVTAQDTARYISRTLRPFPDKPELERTWHVRVSQIASNLICIHLWRCMLILCFRADYEAALQCLHLASAIGHTRKINAACGKNLAFFLDRLLERVRSGNGALHQLEHDEEMLAYVSGDMQASQEHAWVWSGDSPPPQSPPHASPPARISTHGGDEYMHGTNLPLRPNPGSPQNGVRDWDGWGRIEQRMRHLMEEHHARLAQPPSYYPPPHNPMKRVQLSPSAPVSPNNTSGPLPPPTPSNASRISIANII